jgi:hypothetical protein
VIALRESGEEYDLPGRDRVVRRADIPAQKDVLILGERSGGVRDFLDWWSTVLDKHRIPWLFVHAGEWAPDLVRTSQLTPMPGQPQGVPPSQAIDAVITLGLDKSAAEKAEKLLRWADALETVVALIIRVTGNEVDVSTAQAFRMIREAKKCPNLHLIIGTETETSFTDGAFWSGYLALANLYRLRSFGAAETRKLLEWYTRKLSHGLTLSDAAVEELLDCTGGQPRLVQSLLQRAVESSAGKRVDETEIRRLFQQMKQSPPDAVRFWQADLRKILAARPELISAMRSYVTGFTLGPARFPPPAQERPLMVSGWIKLNLLGRWGIASQLHASLARPVLDELANRHGAVR